MGELDPLNRRLGAQKKPDVVVQVVIIAEDNEIRDKLAEHDLHVQTIAEVAPIEVQPARVLSHLYTYLGRNRKLGLSGRKSRDVGILSTSKLYSLKDRIFAFTPQVSENGVQLAPLGLSKQTGQPPPLNPTDLPHAPMCSMFLYIIHCIFGQGCKPF